MKILLKKKMNIAIFACGIVAIIIIMSFGIENKKLKIKNNELQANYEEINKNYNNIKNENSELKKQSDEDKTVIAQLETENKALKEESSTSNNTINNNVDQYNNNNVISSTVDNNSNINNSSISDTINTTNSNDTTTNSSVDKENVENTIVDEKSKMLEKGHKFFADRGIEIDTSQYCEMLGTNLHSGIGELEGHRVFAFTIKNYDIVSNDVWFYYSPDTNAGYRYENETWTKL